MIAKIAMHDPDLAQAALVGLRRYQESEPTPPGPERPVVAQEGGACLRDCGGQGPLLVLVPSVINPPSILDLDPGCSLAGALAGSHGVALLDWGPARERATLDLGDHVGKLLLPLLEQTGPAILVGYCLGGTLALLAAAKSSRVTAVATLASPWNFSAYPPNVRRELTAVMATSRPAAEALGALPMEVLQSAFWSLDPERVVAKFARFGALESQIPERRRFVMLEDWANAGEPLPLPAARELIEDLFDKDLSGSGRWHGGGLPACPMLHVTAANDRIVPARSAAPGPRLDCQAGHVGMIVGRAAPRLLHAPLLSWLEGLRQ